ncbi:MAG TPA: cyclase family protein [Candidatus Limnocylindrales bacterium]|nr:cyclase family protein [Candidatus Limnocylindrales bacterium]
MSRSARTAELIERVAGARVYDLAQPFVNGMPQSPNHPRFHLALSRRHGDVVRDGGGSAAGEVLVLGGHVGTHVDALCHVSQDGLLHGGLRADEAQRGGRFSALGIDTVAPFLARGVLLDVASLHGVTALPGGTVITAGDLEAAAARAGVEPRPGDVVLVRTGWARHWADAEAFVGLETGVPGPGEEAAGWLASHGIRATGADTIAYEALAPGAGHARLPVHRVLLVERGIHIIETLQLEDLSRDGVAEFLFVAAPLKLVGGTGSPLRPLALV